MMRAAGRRQPGAPLPEGAPRSPWAEALARLAANRLAVASATVLALIALAAALAPLLSPHPIDEIYWDRIQQPPDPARVPGWIASLWTSGFTCAISLSDRTGGRRCP